MKALLFSSDFTSLDAISELERLVGKPAKEIKFAVILDAASVEYGGNSYFLEMLNYIDDKFGGFEWVNLLALDLDKIEERLMANDAIYCCGGTSSYLMSVLDKSGAIEILPKILETRVWCGSSAGSMVLGYAPSDKLARDLWGETSYEEKNDWGVERYMELAPICLLAHLYGGDLSQDPRDETVIENSKTMSVPVYALSDWSAVVINGEDIRAIGKQWSVLKDGRIYENNNEMREYGEL